MKLASYTNSSFWSNKISGIAVNTEDHVAGVEADVGVGVSVEIVHEALGFLHGLLGGLCLFRGDLIEGRKNGIIKCAAIIQEAASNRLDELSILWVKQWGCIGCCSILSCIICGINNKEILMR